MVVSGGRAPEPFPTRQYSYAGRARIGLESAREEPILALEPGAVYRFVLGRDAAPGRLTPEDVGRLLHDPLARLVLGPGGAPRTAQALLAALAAADTVGELGQQRVFVVADGGQIPWSEATAELRRGFRFLVTRGRAGQEPTVLVSTTPPFDSEAAFLQVLGWDPVLAAHQFYERREGAWVWAGSAWDALEPDSRGHGPFDSHVNGALNMKELKAPWLHWHSQAARLGDEVLAPDDPLRQDPLWRAREPAERLEVEIVRPAIDRWTAARVAGRLVDGRLTRLAELLRQVLETSTVNLASSPVASRLAAPGRPIPLPLGFFLDSDALLDELGLDPGLPGVPAVDGGVYRDCLARYEVALSDGRHRIPGDTHFAFAVPERAFEDRLALRHLLARGVLTDRLAACLLMVDFPNPVFSPRRAALMAHVPPSASVGAASDFPRAFLAAVEGSPGAGVPDSPEREFLDCWRLPEPGWRPALEERLRAYVAAVSGRLRTLDGFAPLFELAEARRREFRRRPLAEFRLTTPLTSIPEDAPLLEMTAEGAVRPRR